MFIQSILCICSIVFTVGAEDFSGQSDGFSQEIIRPNELNCRINLNNGYHVCDCGKRNDVYYTLKQLSGSFSNLIVQNCFSLYVPSTTFEDVMYIDRIEFRNIKELKLDGFALQFPKTRPSLKVNIIFHNTKFPVINSYAIGESVDSVTFENCFIQKMNAYAINVHETVYSISFLNTEIQSIERQALKKLRIDHLIIHNTTIRSNLESQSFNSLSVDEVTISNCTSASINPRAIDLDDVNKFSFTDNRVAKLDAEAFRMKVKGRIIINGNDFTEISHSALSGIQHSADVKQMKLEIQFVSNVIHYPEYPTRFDVSSDIDIRIRNLTLMTIMDCKQAAQMRHNTFLHPYADSVYLRIRTSYDSVETAPLSNVLESKCTNTSYVIAIISAIAILILLLAIGVVAVLYRYLIKRKPDRNISMVIPDGKTYRETQIILQIENAGLLKTNL